MTDLTQEAAGTAAAATTGAKPAGEKSAAPAPLAPAWRMRVVFERKVVAPYRDTYRGELGQAQVELLELLNASARGGGRAAHLEAARVEDGRPT